MRASSDYHNASSVDVGFLKDQVSSTGNCVSVRTGNASEQTVMQISRLGGS
jgi:hypothetical protein